MDFCQREPKHFSRGPTVMKLHFSNSKLREKLFLIEQINGNRKNQISKSRGPWLSCHALPTLINRQ